MLRPPKRSTCSRAGQCSINGSRSRSVMPLNAARNNLRRLGHPVAREWRLSPGAPTPKLKQHRTNTMELWSTFLPHILHSYSYSLVWLSVRRTAIWFTISFVLLSYFREMQLQYFNACHNCFLPPKFQPGICNSPSITHSELYNLLSSYNIVK